MKTQTRSKGTKRRTGQRPSDAPWPQVGYIGMPQFMHALSLRSAQSVYSYVAQGLLPAPEPIGPNRIGWRVEVARQALDELPGKVRTTAARGRVRSTVSGGGA